MRRKRGLGGGGGESPAWVISVIWCGEVLQLGANGSHLLWWCFPLHVVDPSLNEPRKIAIILALNLRLEPIKAGERAAAAWRSTSALHLISLVVRHRVIEGYLFICSDVPKRQKHDLTLQSEIRLARVVQVHHPAFTLTFGRRADKEILDNLNFRWPEAVLFRNSRRAGDASSQRDQQ